MPTESTLNLMVQVSFCKSSFKDPFGQTVGAVPRNYLTAAPSAAPNTRSVLDCGSPLPLLKVTSGTEQPCPGRPPPYSAQGSPADTRETRRTRAGHVDNFEPRNGSANHETHESHEP
jgi:hypothetical protein